MSEKRQESSHPIRDTREDPREDSSPRYHRHRQVALLWCARGLERERREHLHVRVQVLIDLGSHTDQNEAGFLHQDFRWFSP